jgi:predicted nucleic acid-binding Zn ribbon protein
MWLNADMEQARNNKTNRDRWELDKVRFHLDKPPAPRREIQEIGDILQDVVEGLEQPVQENVLVLRKAWPDLVGAQIAKHSEPGFIKDFALHVFVDHPGWMPELERIKGMLLQKLQSRHRAMRIRRLNLMLEHK